MCGIAGQLDWNAPTSRSVVESMTGRLLHRGPDAQGIQALGRVCFGHTRLAIVDLSSGGAQPMTDATGRIMVTFNGEIYNQAELRRELIKLGSSFRSSSDTEVILEAYAQWGKECVSRFNGMFAFALWDQGNETFLLARDRLGKKPLYYFHEGEYLSFASEHGALAQDPKIPQQINDRAIVQFLSLGYLTTSECINPNIKRLPPGHLLEWRRGSTPTTHRYWDLAQHFLNKRTFSSFSEAAEELNSLLSDAVRVRLMSDVPLGAFLSGGIDSATVVSEMTRILHPPKCHTFSVGFPEKSFSELDAAQSVASTLGATHRQEEILPLEIDVLNAVSACTSEPFADTSIIPMYYLSAFTRKHVTVALSGDGADEIFGGYETYLADKLSRVARLLPPPVIRAVEKVYRRCAPRDFGKVSTDYKILHFLRGCSSPFVEAHFSWRELFTKNEMGQMVTPRILDLIDEAHPLKEFKRFDAEVQGAHYLDRAMYIDIKTWLVDDILVKVDRASMAHALEARAPFLDYRVVEFAARLPVTYKLKGLSKKHILKKSQRPYLNQQILSQRKRGFNAPISQWLFGPLKAICELMIKDSPLHDFITPHSIRSTVEEHLARRSDNSFKLFALIQLHIFLENREESVLGRAA